MRPVCLLFGFTTVPKPLPCLVAPCPLKTSLEGSPPAPCRPPLPHHHAPYILIQSCLFHQLSRFFSTATSLSPACILCIVFITGRCFPLGFPDTTCMHLSFTSPVTVWRNLLHVLLLLGLAQCLVDGGLDALGS